jgi:hypothetical protein
MFKKLVKDKGRVERLMSLLWEALRATSTPQGISVVTSACRAMFETVDTPEELVTQIVAEVSGM